jgi:uncharacterized membrane protein YukC
LWRYGEIRALMYCWRECKWQRTPGKTIIKYLQKLKIEWLLLSYVKSLELTTLLTISKNWQTETLKSYNCKRSEVTEQMSTKSEQMDMGKTENQNLSEPKKKKKTYKQKVPR